MSKKNKTVQSTTTNNKEKNNTKTQKATVKDTTKVDAPPADPTVVDNIETEEIKEKKETIPTKIDLNKIKLSPEQKMSGDGLARLLEITQRHISNMKSDEPATIKMEQMFSYNLAWAITKASIQAREEKMELNLHVPNDDIIVQDIIDTFNNIGVKVLPSHVSEDGKQLSLDFKEVNSDTEKEIKEEIKQEKEPKKAIELDPTKWKDLDEAKTALSNILVQQHTPFPNRFSEALMKVRIFRQHQETDAAKKEVWNTIGLGSLFEDAVSILGNKSTALVRGLCQGVVSSLIADHNPIFAHATVKYNLPVLTDADITDLIKAFIRVQNIDKNIPIDDTLAVKNGILEPTRDFFLQVPRLYKLPIKGNEDQVTQISTAKKIMNKFYEAYKTEVPMADPKFLINATNKMIEIRNMYVDKDSTFELYTEDEYPKESITSENTADSKDKKDSKK